ncbi:tetratricopeptide repeat protein [Thauera sp. Sel9]|uniref:tetratricopeptide repeat protein n=1 Tax=Thauera sp. Sel9 TaxID=2974299 RepID=UPI0021E129DA|nr:tetratricopeptide repeat protein [Thauera sp. Sel9]MCV2219904.1 sel1 repeat family protein [Thauera sp. Sel9]
MSIELAIGIAVLVVIFIMFFTNIGTDYSKRTNQQLLDLWSLHENNVRAAKAVGPEAYKKAVQKMSTLTNELKKRGLLNSDYTQGTEALDSISRKLFSRSLDEIKADAKANDPASLYQLGIIFRAVKELSASIKYISDSANLGYTDAQYALGWAYMTEGSGVTGNACKTIKWFKIAAEQGHVEARKALDVALKSFSRAEAEVALAEADKWLKSKNAEGPAPSAPEPSQTQGNANDALSAAVSELEKLAKIGDRQAQVQLGEMYYGGKEISQDLHRAAALFLEAAKNGSPDAQLYLGAMCENGSGMPKNSLMAMQWYVKAAEGGNAMAQHILSTRIASPES